MELQSLTLRGVGPFANASIDFESPCGVTFFTGLNGSGKTTILDAIRFWFGGQYGLVERVLPRAGSPSEFQIDLRATLDGRDISAKVTDPNHPRLTATETPTNASPEAKLWWLPNATVLYDARPGFVVDYWCPSTTSVGAYEIGALEKPNHKTLLANALDGTYTRARTTQLICHAEFLRESPDPIEARLGSALQRLIERIINESLLDGRYAGLSRASLTPFVEQAGHRVPLGGLSAGNAYQINRMIGLLSKMYSASALRGDDPNSLHETPGLLLIDEAENHLHPRWQKRFIPAVRSIFPNVQIIATTHSPFVLASTPGARVYVTRYDPSVKRCIVSDESAAYAHLSIEEILLSDAFDQTQPWGPEVTRLLEERTRAVESGDELKRREINASLSRMNPVAFGWLKVENEHGPSHPEAP